MVGSLQLVLNHLSSQKVCNKTQPPVLEHGISIPVEGVELLPGVLVKASNRAGRLRQISYMALLCSWSAR